MATFVIVGASLAGAKAAEGLRTHGFDGQVVLIGAEAHRPYERPPLSKAYLAGKASREDAFVHPPEWYQEHDVQLRTRSTVEAIDRDQRCVRLAGGELVRYDKLLLTTGSSPRRLPIPGGDSALYLRTFENSDAIKAAIGPGRRLVVVGAGWIGLEVAAAARQAGADVTIVEVAELPLLQVLGREMAEVFADLHRANGVNLRFGAQLREIRSTGVVLADGTELAAEAVVAGVGITPNTQLAEAAGLTVDNGVVTDAALRTSAPDIFAAGDVANAFHPFLGRHIRVEHWANALKQPATAAAAMVGEDAAYEDLPYFYTDQYDLGMEYVGYVEPDGYDRVVVRGSTESLEFIAFWLREGRVLAGMNVNVWDVVDPIKALVRSRAQVDVDRLTDPDVELSALV